MISRRRLSPLLAWLASWALLALPALACGRLGEPAPVAAPAPRPGATLASAAAQPTSAATPHPLAEVVITEADIEERARSASVQGATVEGLDVEFLPGRMRLRVARLGYGFLDLQDVLVEGALRAADGWPVFEATRIEPNNLATRVIPPLINQYLGWAASGWYVEDLRLEPGRLVLLARPA